MMEMVSRIHQYMLHTRGETCSLHLDGDVAIIHRDCIKLVHKLPSVVLCGKGSIVNNILLSSGEDGCENPLYFQFSSCSLLKIITYSIGQCKDCAGCSIPLVQIRNTSGWWERGARENQENDVNKACQ